MRYLQIVFIALLQFLLWHYDVFPEIKRIPGHGILPICFLLLWIAEPESQWVERLRDDRIFEFHHETALLDIFRLGIYGEYACGVFLLNILSGRFCSLAGFRFCELDFFGKRIQHAQSVCLQIVYIKEECVRLSFGIIHPYFQAVLLDVELSDDFLLWDTLDPQRVNPGVWGHECNICRTLTNPFLIDYHLLWRNFLEKVELILLLPCQTTGCVLHVIFLYLRECVIDHHYRPDERIKECNFFCFRIIFIIIVLIHHSIKSVRGILNVSKAEKTPFIGLDGSIRSMKENSRIRMVLVKHYSGTFDRLQGIAVLNKTGNQHWVNDIAGREYHRIARKHIPFVVISNGIGKVQRISPVAVQISLERDDHALSFYPVKWSFFQRRGEEDALGILHHHIFIENNLQFCLVSGNIHRPLNRICLCNYRWNRILGTTGRRLSSVCTRMWKQHRAKYQCDRYGRYEKW